MTVEELDIVVQASIEQALTEFKKIVPQLKRTIKQVEDNLNDIDTKGMTNKVQQAVQQVKQKINEVKNTGVEKQLQTQFNRAGASVQKYQGQLDQAKEKLRQVYAEMDNIQANTWKAYTPEGVEIGNKAIEPAVNNDLSGNKQYQDLSKEATKLEQQILSLNGKLNETRQQYNQIGGQIQQISKKQNMWKSAVEKVKGTFSSFGGVASKIKESFNQIPKITNKISTKIAQMGTGFKQGLGHILKYAGALFSLQSIYSTLSGAANSWLSSQNSAAQQLNANIEYMKYSMGSALAPVIEFITNLVFQLMKAIQSLVYAFSGINIFANASAKAYSSMASSAKEANKETKQLAGVHSEINNIQSNDNSSSGSGGGSVKPSFDLSQIDSQMSPLAQKLYDFFKPLVDSWNAYGTGLVEQVKTTASQIGELLSSVWGSFEEIITNGTAYSILENILVIIGNIAQAWANAWTNDNNGTEIIQSLANMLNDVTEVIVNLVSSTGFQNFLDGVLSAISGIVQFLEPIISGFSEVAGIILEIVMSTIGDLLTTIGNALQTIAQNETASAILEAVGMAIGIIVSAIVLWNAAQLILNGLMTVFTVITSPIGLIILGIVAAITTIILIIQNWGAISEWFSNLWTSICTTLQEVWNSVKEFFVNLWQGICDTAMNVWNGIKDFFVNIWTGISTFFSNIWNGIKNVAMTVWNAITTTISNVINGIKNTISNVLNTIKTVWSNIWNGIKNVVTSVWNGIWNIIKSVVNNILSGIEGFVNGVIRGINWVLSGISKVANAVGSLIGLNPISLQLSTISLPRLAKGAVLKVPTVAEMAEYPGASTNPEIVTPQNIMEETFDRVLARYQDNDNSQSIYLTVNVGNAKLGQILLDDLRNMKRRSGKGIEALVGG